ncbi:hypothetical protein GGR92_002504 [Spirosoma lacussanchae]|uniref:lipocalin family protein n=1 Tax=Spirosoma lacussanchae TaxID=1884249 RepID=UPI001109524A|nr:lipocalin family protein [Spirosoma lacussanchae]
MKNVLTARLLAWALMLAIPFWFGSCKKDSDDAVTPNAIEGTWRISGLKISPGADLLGTGQKVTDLIAYLNALPNGLGADIVTCLTTTTITFNSNGRITSKDGQKCTSATGDLAEIEDNSTWKLEGTKLTLTDNSGSEVYDVAQSGNTLKLSTSAQEDYGDGLKTYTTTIEMTR